MANHSQHMTWDAWPGWSTISASNQRGFTLWFTGLSASGKTTLAHLVKKVLLARGFKVEIIDPQAVSFWLKHAFPLDEARQAPPGNAPDLGAILTYICTLLARNEIITITTTVCPYRATRDRARSQIGHFLEIYLHCPEAQRARRLKQPGRATDALEHSYEPPLAPELNIDSGLEPPEICALRIISYLEQHGFVPPLWEETYAAHSGEELLLLDEEANLIKARLQSLGYLE